MGELVDFLVQGLACLELYYLLCRDYERLACDEVLACALRTSGYGNCAYSRNAYLVTSLEGCCSSVDYCVYGLLGLRLCEVCLLGNRLDKF